MLAFPGTSCGITIGYQRCVGPVDPQIGSMTAALIVNLLCFKKPAQISDEMLILVDMAQITRIQVASFVVQVLLKHMPQKRKPSNWRRS